MEKLDDLIIRYAANKLEFDSYKKIVDKENAEIKAIMLSSKLDSHEAGGYKATCTVSQRETMNEEMLISLFTSVPGFVSVNNNYSIVKMKPYIDFDALENALYHNELTTDQMLDMDKAREVKEVVTLRLTKIKEKQED